MNQVVIGLGSNIEPEKNIAQARKILSGKFRLLQESQFTRTSPVGYTEQADFVNGAVLVETELAEEPLKKELKQIEIDMGRVVSEIKSGPRSIDLDILVFNGTVVDRDVYERTFLRDSINELLPKLVINQEGPN